MKAAHDVVSAHVGEKYVYRKKPNDHNVKIHAGFSRGPGCVSLGLPQDQSPVPFPIPESLKYRDETWIGQCLICVLRAQNLICISGLICVSQAAFPSLPHPAASSTENQILRFWRVKSGKVSFYGRNT